jgi:hypothetical protein
MSEMTQHEIERLSTAIGSVLFNASNYPSAVAPHVLGQNIGPLRQKVFEAVLAALTPRSVANRECSVCHGNGTHPRGGTHCPSCLGVGVELS